MASAGRKQPQWQRPGAPTDGVNVPPLKIYNSLVKGEKAVPFIPIDPHGEKVTWYACGPTVYDDAHLGHARNYVTTDILRRILRDYFKFDVKFVMNITDVDDKIILRGRQQHLLSEFKSKNKSLNDSVVSTAQSAFQAYITKNLPLLPEDLRLEQYDSESKRAYKDILEGKSVSGDGTKAGDKEAKIKMHLKTGTSAAEALMKARIYSGYSEEEFYAKTEDVFLPYLDSLHGKDIDAKDHSIFTKLTQRYEHRFMEDVRALNCLDPDVVTRVTDYGQQIVDFVSKIEKNKFAYATSDGSVYFDINAFEKAGNKYARLEPWNVGNKELQAEGEGALIEKTSEKRSEADFALWKSSKPGEPSWPSPWGNGRPGWHIECSAMASDVIGPKIDIHSGGIDLAFPHHDNELAQSEAYWVSSDHSHGPHQWVNYFLHMGHLSISGSKMSKSLKNFTTIRDALARGEWTQRSLRIVFLLGGWKDGVEITESLVLQGNAWEDKVTNFFLKARDLERNPPAARTDAESDSTLAKALSEAQSELDSALCNSFDTLTAMHTISKLITSYNSLPTDSLSTETVFSVARWVTQIVTIFGLDGTANISNPNRIGWEGTDIPEIAKPFVYPLSLLRDEVRKRAIADNLPSDEVTALAQPIPTTIHDLKAEPYSRVLADFQAELRQLSGQEAAKQEYLALCDKVRNVQLWNLGVYLEDREGQPAMVRPVDEELVAARAEKEQREQAKREAKEKREREEAEKAAKKAEQAKVSHTEMYRSSEFSAWDEDGLPTKDAKGEDVAKSKLKKLRKDWEKQKKLHEEWLASGGQK